MTLSHPLAGLLRPGLVVPVRSGPSGPSRGSGRGPGFRASSRGYVVPASAPTTVEQRIVEAAVLLPPGGAVTGWAALRWWGGIWFDGSRRGAELAVPLAGATQRRDQPGVVWSRERLAPDRIVLVDGLPVTTPVHAVVHAVRHAATLVEAVRVLDLACYSDLLGLDDVRAHLDRIPRHAGSRQLRATTELADENSWSPREVDLRMACELLAGTPPLLTNRAVFDLAGRHLLTPDLLEPDAGLAIEYDGGDHRLDRVRRRDRDHAELRQAAGLPSLTVLAGDAPGRVADRVRAALRSARERPPADRAWTVEPPPWWTETRTVAQRLALSPVDQRRLLGHRRRLPPLLSVVPVVTPVHESDEAAAKSTISEPLRHIGGRM